MNDDIKTLKAEVQDVLENNILDFWLSNMIDDEHGGFYGQMTGEGELVKDADKGGILSARILWAFSAAYRVLGAPEYLMAATLIKDYIIEYFYDNQFGGTYWSVDYLGNPKDTKKQFYAIGFMIYGLSEYARATGDQQALDYAIKLFDCIEQHSLDKVNNGYIEAQTRQWNEIADMRLSELDANFPKSQNTHLHIIEPYTNLYRCLMECDASTVSSDVVERVEKALRNLIDIFTDKILNPVTHHLDLFFAMDWTREAGALESYGHDIECSWLMHEAALVLGDQAVLDKVEPIVKLVAKASEKGLNADGSMVHEANLDTGYASATRARCKRRCTAGNTSRTTSSTARAASGSGVVMPRVTSTAATTRQASGNAHITTRACVLKSWNAISNNNYKIWITKDTVTLTTNTANTSSPTRRRRGPGSTTWATRISSH